MEKTGKSLIFPTREDIIKLNHRHIEISGGEYFPPDNLINPGSLEWVLDAIQYPLFGIALPDFSGEGGDIGLDYYQEPYFLRWL